ncbi:PLP-dependent aminotransferase family protein [Brucella pseudogrignonensis]|uniref:aminotransferase-like domain-containing protein n=1 Tax=Brucella pseudogrignonensis TaxID=419475 RepID=UPI003D972AD0
MRLQSPWTPRISDNGNTPANRLLEALAEDILSGQLLGGDRLPAHRDLAWKLNIGVGTVTKAYAMLERRGLARSIKGSGTFVAVFESRKGPAIDFSVNRLPVMLSDRLLAGTLSAISRKINSAHVNLYPPPAGHDEHRRLLARWLESLSIEAEAKRIILAGSGQQALWLAFDILCGGNGLIVTERLSYSGAIALARYRGHPMRSVNIDDQGMVPDDLDRVLCEEENSGRRRLVYLTPTLHNPTTISMGANRRKEIVDVCNKRNVAIVEDGVYTLGSSPNLPPLVTLAPDRVFHVTSLSKSLSPGLRLGVLVLPSGWEEYAEEALRALPLSSSPVDYALLEEWFTSGVMETVRGTLRAEARQRAKLARSFFDNRTIMTDDCAFHAWLPMSHTEAEAFEKAAATLGVVVTEPDAVRADRNDNATGIRLCLGGLGMEDLTTGLTLLSRLKTGEHS